jgi:hypothetical protein
MTTVLAIAGLTACFGLVLWAALRSARSAGGAEVRAEEAQHAVENAERITAARDAAPADVGALAKRVLDDGKPL